MDEAHEWTEEEIERLTKRIRHEYSQAEKEMRQKLEKLMADFDEQNKDWQARMAAGKSTRNEYEAWLKYMSMNRELVEDMADTLAHDAVNADKRAMELINDAIPTVYAENANRAAYGIDLALGQDHSFDLYDQSTVRRLISNPEADLLPIQQPPIPNPKVDARKDKPWNKRKFNSAITQSILQGESIPDTAKRLQTVLKMDEGAAVRAARTAMTGAANAGRVDSYRRAKAIGIDLEQEWMAVLDMRTRHSHRQLDGQHVPVGEKFKVDGIELEFPADPTAPPEYVYNCRCTLVAWFPDLDKDERWSKLPSGMTYDDWKSGKKAEKKQEAAGVVNGKDILGTWKRREDKFDFEIEDVLNAQGFDGKPRVVSAEEFDEAVKAANGGNGFIAQRSYSAPNQEVLDSYRQTLYDGKWYVDCSTGGAQYGQGMYCASDYTGELSRGIREEMRHYTKLGAYRNGELLSEAEYLARITDDLEANGLLTGNAKRYAENHRLLEKAASEHKTANSLYKEKRELESVLGGDAAQIRDILEDHPVFGGQTYIETLTLDPSARIVEYDDIQMMRRSARETIEDSYRPRFAELDEILDMDELGALRKERDAAVNAAMNMDDGAFAAAMGYDAINAAGHGRSGSYTVILNRTKLIIKEPE